MISLSPISPKGTQRMPLTEKAPWLRSTDFEELLVTVISNQFG